MWDMEMVQWLRTFAGSHEDQSLGPSTYGTRSLAHACNSASRSAETGALLGFSGFCSMNSG